MAVRGISKGEFVKRGHDLPHWQIGGRTYFITFRTRSGHLSNPSRMAVLDVILEGRQKHFDLHAAVVMPDHVHLLLTPKEIERDLYYDLSQICKGIKGASARAVNRLERSTGSIWQPESYDRMIRDENEFSTTWNYIFNNPVWAHLTKDPEEYRFFWSQVYDPNES